MSKNNIFERIQKKCIESIGTKKTDALKTIISILLHPVKKIKNINRLKYLAEHNRCIDEYTSLDYTIWNKGFRKLLLSCNEGRALEMIEEFYNNPLELIVDCKISETDPVVVCALKNEIYRIPEFLKHYRGLGVKSFIIIDNDSDDGTMEYLMEQGDVRLYRTVETYNSRRKTAWINKAISYNGIHRWYLIPDSDEFFVYPEIDEMDLPKYISQLGKKNISIVKTMMLEMYPKGSFFDDLRDPANFREDYCYFDGDRSSYRFDRTLGKVSGGFHNRFFPEVEDGSRIKCTLLYYDGKSFELGSHDVYPFYKYFDAQYGGIVLHYKFLANERDKIKKIIEKGTYANGSRLYRLYDKKFSLASDINPYYEGSVKWDGKNSFELFDFIQVLAGDEGQ